MAQLIITSRGEQKVFDYLNNNPDGLLPKITLKKARLGRATNYIDLGTGTYDENPIDNEQTNVNEPTSAELDIANILTFENNTVDFRIQVIFNAQAGFESMAYGEIGIFDQDDELFAIANPLFEYNNGTFEEFIFNLNGQIFNIEALANTEQSQTAPVSTERMNEIMQSEIDKLKALQDPFPQYRKTSNTANITNFYLADVASETTGYKQLLLEQLDNPIEQSTQVTLDSTAPFLIEQFVVDYDLENPINLSRAAGNFSLKLFTPDEDVYMYIEYGLLDQDGNQINVFTSEQVNLTANQNMLTVIELSKIINSSIVIDAGNRLYIRVYGVKTGGGDKELTIYYNNNESRANTLTRRLSATLLTISTKTPVANGGTLHIGRLNDIGQGVDNSTVYLPVVDERTGIEQPLIDRSTCAVVLDVEKLGKTITLNGNGKNLKYELNGEIQTVASISFISDFVRNFICYYDEATDSWETDLLILNQENVVASISGNDGVIYENGEVYNNFSFDANNDDFVGRFFVKNTGNALSYKDPEDYGGSDRLLGVNAAGELEINTRAYFDSL